LKYRSTIAFGLFVVAFTLFGCATQRAGQADAGWITLINGEKGLENWDRVAAANWRAADGAIVADRLGGKDPAYLVSKNAYRDFEIRAEFWVTSETNSGIFIRCADPQKIGAANCYEVNIWDTRPDPTYGTGAIVNVAKVSPMPRAGGRWNTYEITARGSRLTVKLNGVQTVDVSDSKLAGGAIALQYGSGIVKFRMVQIRPL